MTERWYQEKKREAYYRRAKREGYRARSAFKLVQIQEKFRIMRKGDTVVDLGAAPGGWSQAALEIAGPTGRVFGVDLQTVRPLEGAVFLRGDMTKPETVEALRRKLVDSGGRPSAHVVVSDMSPDISGNYDRDQAESVYLCQKALEFAEQVLERGGNLLLKVFEGQDYPELMATLKKKFDVVFPYRPEATRRQSSEVYLVAKGYKGSPAKTRDASGA